MARREEIVVAVVLSVLLFYVLFFIILRNEGRGEKRRVWTGRLGARLGALPK